jgi:hypothetical protein
MVSQRAVNLLRTSKVTGMATAMGRSLLVSRDTAHEAVVVIREGTHGEDHTATEPPTGTVVEAEATGTPMVTMAAEEGTAEDADISDATLEALIITDLRARPRSNRPFCTSPLPRHAIARSILDVS